MDALPDYVAHLFDDVTLTREQMHGYQNTAVDFLLAHPFSALFVDLGLGKSVISLTTILNLVSNFEIGHALVIGPVRVVAETWPTEIRNWRHTAPLSFAHIRDENVVDAVNVAGQTTRAQLRADLMEKCLWNGMTRSEAKRHVDAEIKVLASPYVTKKRNGKETKVRIPSEMDKARTHASKAAVRKHFRNNPAVVHLVNREQVEFLVDAWGRDWPYDCVIIDESSSLKDHTTLRFKALNKVRPLIKRMHQLTATPAAETYMHLFAQIYLLDRGERLGRNISAYREAYFTYNPYSHAYKLRPGAEEQIAGKISDICLTMKAEDHLSLAKPVMLMEKIILSPAQKALYDMMEKENLVELPDGKEIEAETAAALSQKLLQMSSGVLYETVMDDVGNGNFKKRRVVHHLHEHKIEKLQTIVEEAHGETLLVAYWHEASLERLKRAFPKAVAMDREGKCIKPWNAGKIPMLLVHPQSSGHGLNLQHGGRRIVLFDIPWSLELYLQLIGRLARQGQKHVVMVHHLVAVGTLDEAVVEALREKRDAQELLFFLLKRIRAKNDRRAVSTTNSCEKTCILSKDEL